MKIQSDAPSPTQDASRQRLTDLLSRVEALAGAALRVPLGHSCRSCGSSTYNQISRISHYLATGDACCASMREWLDSATPIAMSAAQRRASAREGAPIASTPGTDAEGGSIRDEHNTIPEQTP